MRTLTLVLSLVVLLAVAGTATAPAASPPATTFVLTGGGWGHGVGMSQWGAFGQAKAGRGYKEILDHYYRGTTLGAAPATRAREGARPDRRRGLGSVAVTSPSAIVVVDGKGKRHRLPGAVALDRKLELPVGKEGKPKALPPPLTLQPTDGANLVSAGKAYRGTLEISRSGGRLQLVNTVGLEAYLLGVVPGEMPKDWPLEALKAQAVAARTFAVRGLLTGRSFDLYSDWRSQVYYGVGSEAPGTTRAVRETRGEILTHEGKPAQVFYFSSSGGRTLSALDVFGSDVPYLVSVDDPWDETSPHHRWPSQVLSGAQVAKRFGLAGVVADASLVPGTPGKPAVLRLTTVAGGTSEVRLSDVRARLGLKSTGFQLGVLRLDPPTLVRVPSGALVLTGLARRRRGSGARAARPRRRLGGREATRSPTPTGELHGEAARRQDDRVSRLRGRPLGAERGRPGRRVTSRAVLGAVVAGAALVAGIALGATLARATGRAQASGSSHAPARRGSTSAGRASPTWSPRRRSRRLEFSPTDPLATRQWYAVANRAYDAWPTLPPLAPVRVAVIDSGIDLGHPDLQRRIVLAKSFVGGSAQDTRGHGTIVAGVIAAELDNATGIAGLAPAAELLVAKVVGPAGTVSVEAEAKAIVWAVDNGARIVNISLGGLRDPRNSGRDTYSRREEEAIRYAVRQGRRDRRGGRERRTRRRARPGTSRATPPRCPTCSGSARSRGAAPRRRFSNRDAVYNDVAAPGEDIISTFPRSVTAERPACADQGYTPCASDDFRPPEGTSFAAPQVTAVAANLLGARPLLRAGAGRRDHRAHRRRRDGRDGLPRVRRRP